jgi:hypothetical protein
MLRLSKWVLVVNSIAQISSSLLLYHLFSIYCCIIVYRTPVVCGITSLGLDHVQILGNTIEQIAWQKAGIFKKDVPAVTVPQVPEAMRILIERAEEKHVNRKKKESIKICMISFSVY